MHVKGKPWQYLLPSASGKIYIYIHIPLYVIGDPHSAAALGEQRSHVGSHATSCAAALAHICPSPSVESVHTHPHVSIGRESTHTIAHYNCLLSEGFLDVLVGGIVDEGHGIPAEGTCPLAEGTDVMRCMHVRVALQHVGFDEATHTTVPNHFIHCLVQPGHEELHHIVVAFWWVLFSHSSCE